MMSEPKLTPQQKAVVDNRGGTLLVSAAAGSGKTKVLVDRVMDRILHDGRNINQFLIITFTNAAAAELRSKISRAIVSALGQDPTNRHIQRQMNLISLAQISTVHSFCGNLIRQYGYLLEIPGDYAMLEEAERSEMLQRILTDVLDEFYEEMTPGFQLLVDTLGAGRNDDRLVEMVQDVFEKLLSQPYPEKWLKNQKLTLDPSEDLGQTGWGRILIENAKKQIIWLIERYDWAIKVMEVDEKLMKKYLPAYESQRKQLQDMLLVFDGPWDQIGSSMTMTFPPASVRDYPDKELLEQIKSIKEDNKKLLIKLQKQFSRSAETLIGEQNQIAPALEALLLIVERLYGRFSVEKRNKNLLDFSDQEHLAIRLLVRENGKPTEVAQEVANQFVEIMVDEYQDSNRVQELIYRAISGPGDQNRFLVGDVKQSIYSFRQAEPELFLEKYQTYQEGAKARPGEPRYLVLSRNFRSRPEVLEAANHVFQTVMSPALGGLEYDEREMLYPGLDAYPQDHEKHVELNVLSFVSSDEGRDDESNKYQKEARWVAGRVARLLNSGAPVRDGDGVRPVRPEDVAILFRSRDPMAVFARELNRAGIPVLSDSGEDIFQTPEVQVLMNLLRVLDNPRQDVPLLSVLCSPLFRFSNELLARIRMESKSRRFYDAMCSAEIPEVQDALGRLEELKALARRLSGESLVWHLLNEGGLLRAYSAMDGGEERRNNLLTVYNLACTAAGGEHIYLYELLRYLERQAVAGVPGAAAGDSGVTLTTIHKSKGLEYPVVFLSDLSREFNTQELKDRILVDGEDGIGARITDLEQRRRYTGIAFEALKVKKEQKLLSEELRVLYVAMTRPRDYLFMTYATGNGIKHLKRLVDGAGMPAEKWAASGANCLGDWVLLGAMNQIEGGALFEVTGRPKCQCMSLNYPWEINFMELEEIPQTVYVSGDVEKTDGPTYVPTAEGLIRALQWEYPYREATVTPSKVTANQLKGRDKDQEVADNTVAARTVPQLARPKFILEDTGLSPTEKGTAAHLFLQYADFQRLRTPEGVWEEAARLVDDAYMTEQQADSVDQKKICGLFQSPLGERLLQAEQLVREFKFSMLTDAEVWYPGMQGEQVLLQGVVDAAIIEEDGVTVIDFKTDRVTGTAIQTRAEHYRGQLMTYKSALERIFHKPVREMILYFLYPGEEVQL